MIVRRVVAAALAGAVVGMVVALVGNWWAGRNGPTAFGWYAYSPLPAEGSSLPAVNTDWGRLLWPAAVVGAVVGVIAMLVWTRLRHDARGHWVPLSLGTAGVVLGLAVGGALALLDRPPGNSGHPRRYVDYLPTDGGSAYASTFSFTIDDDPSGVWAFLGVCTASGLILGLLVAGVITVARRRGIPRGTAGAA